MPTPERNTDRLPSSRRMYEQQQQRSPFSRARGNSRAAEDFDASRIPSPSYKYHIQRRTNFKETNTLTGAFRKAGRYATMAENEGISASVPYVRGTPSPGGRRQAYNVRSPESNPPNELAEAYRQIDDADSVVDPEPEDVYGHEDSYGHEDRIGRSSGYYARDYDVFATSDASFLNETQDESPRRRLSDHIQDEQRLRRATTSHSPVLSSRGGTKNALTAENLLRREEEELVSGDDDTFHHELNVPSTWGSRAKRNTDWLKKLKRREEPEPEPEPEPVQRPERAVNVSPPVTKFEFDFSTSPGRSLEPASSRYSRIPLSDARNKLSSEHKDDKPIGGNSEPIANTPIIVYKNSGFTKPSPSKRDSHDLIRRLARRESPDQNRNQQELRTPEAPKGGQRRIYDKTPVVTGAWIDTPMTERISEGSKMPVELTNGSMSQVTPNEPNPVIPEVQEEADVEVKGFMHEREWDADRNEQEQQEREREKEQEKAKMEEEEKARKEDEKKKKEVRKQEEEQQKSKEPEKKTKPPLIKPDLPKSALESVIQEHKADKETLDVGDDTIESLQELLAEQSTEAKADPQTDAAYEKSIMERLERSQGDEDMGDHKISEKLLSLEENQDSLRKKIDGVEEQMTQNMPKPKIPEDSSPPTSQAPKQLKRTRAGKTCKTCGVENDGRIYASIPLPLLWKRDPISRRIRITRLGWSLLLSLLWFVSESTMCDYYCHPTVAPVCEGNCLRRDAPQFPFVLPTMLWRWSHLSSALAPVATLGIAFIRLLAQLLGLWDGYVDVPPRTLNLSGEVRIYGTRITHSPVIATATPGFFARQWPAKELRHTPEAVYTPEAVPESRLEEELPPDVWDDDSMDDDELL